MQKVAANKAEPVDITKELANTAVEALDLSIGVYETLKRTGLTTVGDVLDLLDKDQSAVISIRHFGIKSLDELRQKMREKGYLRDELKSDE
jgi:DNA-directed RNA polymerase subunit alpha